LIIVTGDHDRPEWLITINGIRSIASPNAELGSAFRCADLGVTPDVRKDRAAYIATWPC
jgi:antirestriction protein ArdC